MQDRAPVTPKPTPLAAAALEAFELLAKDLEPNDLDDDILKAEIVLAGPLGASSKRLLSSYIVFLWSGPKSTPQSK